MPGEVHDQSCWANVSQQDRRSHDSLSFLFLIEPSLSPSLSLVTRTGSPDDCMIGMHYALVKPRWIVSPSLDGQDLQ